MGCSARKDFAFEPQERGTGLSWLSHLIYDLLQQGPAAVKALLLYIVAMIEVAATTHEAPSHAHDAMAAIVYESNGGLCNMLLSLFV